MRAILATLPSDSCPDLDVDGALVRIPGLDVLCHGRGDGLVQLEALVMEVLRWLVKEGEGDFSRSRSGGCQTLGLPPLWEPSLLPRFI